MIKRSIKICEEEIQNTPMGIRVSFEHDLVNLPEIIFKEANKKRNENLKVYSHEKRFEKSNLRYKYYIRDFGSALVTEIGESEYETKKLGKEIAYREPQYTLTTYLDVYFQ